MFWCRVVWVVRFMKGTTLRRSNLTKENIAMMQSLANYSKIHQNKDFYREQSKERELDVLWQNFRVSHKPVDRSPQVYFVLGLIVGAVITLIMTTIVSILINCITPREAQIKTPKVKTEEAKFTFIPADTAAVVDTPALPAQQSYTVQSGDTLEAIIVRFYGSFDLNKVDLIKEANKMANPNALSIGQKLVIPMVK